MTHCGQTIGGLTGDYFNHKIAINYVGPFEGHLFGGITSKEFYILTITDTHTRYTMCKIPTAAKSKNAFELLQNKWIEKF
ncbi:hypothetical protein M153_8050003180 [Pseudoloma neurophilia]|uniref:Transposable element n=1 Tax=Pseudoloma neurophilia TaxID=146866 RepID=A0A0R0M1L9_9MICR|nr:hypothetical protein M153_8050003180 [Pseudoloma neurophilia]